MTKTKRHHSTTPLLLLLAFLGASVSVLCDNELRIHDVSEFIAFSGAVNSGTDYEGMTVYLGSDIDFTDDLSQQFKMVGEDYNNYFRGTFDGQGHVIRNLKVTSPSYQYVGLFGYSTVTTIKNVVIDKTCSFTNNYISEEEEEEASAGGIIGICNSDDDSCTLENNVNMADITFNGSISGQSYTGGIVGELYMMYYGGAIKNCANYGTVSSIGTSKNSVYLGGVVSFTFGEAPYYIYVQNCANYGTVFYNGTTSYGVFVGGISGYSYYSIIDNCVSSGPIVVDSSRSGTKYVGSIVGYVSGSTITHSYWNASIGYDVCGGEDSSTITDSYPFDLSSFELTGSVSIGNYAGTSLIGALNGAADYYTLRDYSHWALNKDSRNVSFTVNKTKLSFTTSTQIILLPDLADEGNMTFSGWYTDSACTVPLTDFTIDSDEKKDLYGLLAVDENNYTINFDTRGGSALPSITSPYGSTVELPTSTTRSGCSFLNWETEYGDLVTTSTFAVPSRNITLYAVWLCEHITTARDLIAFSDAVNSGTNFIGTTVYLDSDIDFTDDLPERFEMIGKDYNNYFRGTFDGQGHVVRNLAINASSSYQYIGLFGYSTGTTIQNVVIDETCCFTNNFIFEYYDACTGSIIGYCDADEDPCTLENNVNMAGITFFGSIGGESFAGGIVGGVYVTNYQVTIKNCANYGIVLSTGTSENKAYVGGIISYARGESPYYTYVQNCANYGTVHYNGVSNDFIVIGGISGYSYYSSIDNCVSSGPVVVDSLDIDDTYVGSIVGDVFDSTITRCYWNKSIGYDVCGDECSTATITDSYSFNPSSFELAGSVSIGNYAGTSLIGALNGAADYYILRDYSHWALNKDSRNVSFTVNGRAQPSFTTSAQIILLPDLAGEGNMTFSGWYTDSACTVPLTDFVIDSDEKKDLYGLWGVFNYTINFNTRGGSVLSSIISQYGTTVELKNATRSGCNFLNWETEYGYPVANSFTVPSRNITLYAVWLCERITTASDLIAFSKDVNSGTNYEGTTVYLDSDIDFTDGLSEQFEVIGRYPNCFRGTFDGQGHVVRNLAINASSTYQHVGLFGYSAGTTIQNVVIDETCSVVDNFISSEGYVTYAGGIIGVCRTNDDPCALENNVNMADVTFNGNTGGYSYTGGIIGILYMMNYQATIKNCANYGTVSSTGTSENNAYLGGIVGFLQGSSTSTSNVYVQNCANYGTVLYRGSSNEPNIGGISGYSIYSTVDNCVSSGPIVDSSRSGTKYVGSIVGYVSGSNITHCYWNASIGYGVCDYEDYSSTITDSHSFDPSSFELVELVSIGNYAGTSLIGALNGAADYYTLRDYSHWALNKDSRNVSFTVNGRAQPSFTTSAQVILLPDLASEGNMAFNGWYTDNACEDLFTDFIIDSDEKKDLYGLLTVDENNHTINFDTRGGSVIPSLTSPYGTTIGLPTSITRDGCSFLNWETEYGYPVPNSFAVPSRNITLYAVWLCGHITTARDLIAFSGAVNSGTNFLGMTVYLDSDIDFTDDLPQRFEAIGKYLNFFRGTFDGQGHVIRNLAINASPLYKYVGLFGGSTGTTIQNVVIDETCSVVNNFISSESQAYTGSVIGVCRADDDPCALENSVNMADITFNGNISGESFTGGIAGAVASSKHEGTIKNCANYGTVSSTETSKNSAFLGGIVGSSQSSTSTLNAYVQNCANYGTILYRGSSNKPRVGGISGYSSYSTIDNCVSSGPVVVYLTISVNKYVGSIVGYAFSSTTITHCYWTLDVRCNDVTGYPGDSVTTTETLYVECLNTTTLGELNAYVTSHKLDGFSQWVMLRLNGGSVSNLTQSDLVVAQEHFPSPVKEGNTFLRWCKDLKCDEVYDNDLTGVTVLYAVWKTVRMTFTFWNGTTAGPVSVEYGTTYGALPEAGSVVEGHTLCWFISNNDDDDDGDERVVTPDTIVTTISDHTLHGRWVANNYTVTLDLGNGTVIARTLQYNESIELPQGIAREGCTHTGWNNSNNTTNMPAKNITINALWDCTHNSHSPSSSGDKSKSSSNTGAIVGGVVGGLVAIILIVLAVLFFILFKDREEEDSTWGRAARRMKMRRSKTRGRSSGARNTKQQTRRGNRGEGFEAGVEMATDTARTYEKLYPTWYNVSTMQDALTSAGLSQSQAKSVVDACNLTGRNAEREGKLCEGLRSGDAAAIAMYTYSFDEGNYGSNPYRLINEALMGGEEEGGELDEVKGLLYLVMCSLRKLPRYTGRTLYRGVKEGVDRTLYKKGSSVVWHGLSSTSPDMNAVRSFLADKDVGGKVSGTLFVIDKGWGYDIQPYSLFPEEAEILLEPEREFKVQSVIEAELTIINLEMVDTPVILPEIFGEGAN